MAKRKSAARRYAEAAFEIAMRDDTVADWRTDLELVAAQVAEVQVLDVLRNPAIPTEQRSQALTGILAGLSATAIGRNPDAAGQIRGIAIILAAFAEGLGVLAIVVGLLAIFIK